MQYSIFFIADYEHKTFDSLVQITLFGDSATGKGSLLRRYMNGTFDEKDPYRGYGPDFQTFVYENTEAEIIKVRIWILVHSATGKTSNQTSETYFAMPAVNLVTFSFSERDSFISADHTLTKLQELNPQSIKLLVGTKNDLTKKQHVTEEEARQLADKFGVIYYSTSAKSGMNVKALFERAINASVERNKKLNPLFVERKQSKFIPILQSSAGLFNYLGSFFSLCYPTKQTATEYLLDPEYKNNHKVSVSKH